MGAQLNQLLSRLGARLASRRAAIWLFWIAAIGLMAGLSPQGTEGPGAFVEGIAGDYEIVRAARWLNAGPEEGVHEAGPPDERMQQAGMPVALPHRTRKDLAAPVINWYRISLQLRPEYLTSVPPTVCVPRWGATPHAYIDGHELLASPIGAAGLRDWTRPQYFTLPPGLAAGEHVLDIRLRALPGLDPGLSEIWFGDGTLIRHACQRFSESKRERAFGSALMMGCMALVGVLLLILLRDFSALYFFLTAFLWILHFWIVTSPPLSLSEPAWSLLYFASRPAFLVPLFIFCLRFTGVDNRPFERLMVLGYVLALGILLALPPARWSGWFSVMAVVMLSSAVCFMWLLVRYALRNMQISGHVLSAAFGYLILTNVLDLLRWLGLTAYGGSPLSYIAVPLLFGAFGAMLGERFVRNNQREADIALHLRTEVARMTEKIARDFAVLQKQGERLAVLEERRRIVRDMHDGLGSHLVSASALLRSAQPPEREHVLQAIDSSLQELRIVLDVLSIQAGNGFDDDPVSTLLGSLRWRIAPVLQSRGITLQWEADALPARFLAEDGQRLHLLRLLQEMFANVVKHAQARNVRFCSCERDAAIWIEMHDDGQGFDPAARLAQPSSGLGLHGMLARCAQLGARMDIDSGAHGTSIRIRFDWAPDLQV